MLQGGVCDEALHVRLLHPLGGGRSRSWRGRSRLCLGACWRVEREGEERGEARTLCGGGVLARLVL